MWYALQCIWQAWIFSTAFDEARRRLVAQIVEDHNIHAFLHEMAGLEGQAMFECVESKFSFARCRRHGSVEAPRSWQKMAMQLLAKVEEERVKKRVGVLFELEGRKQSPDLQFHVS